MSLLLQFSIKCINKINLLAALIIFAVGLTTLFRKIKCLLNASCFSMVQENDVLSTDVTANNIMLRNGFRCG